MKRILLCGILALAVAGMTFAQWPDGFSVAGQVRTGLRMDFLGGQYYGVGKGLTPIIPEDRSSVWMWHDDAGNRAQLDMKFVAENYGFRFIPRFQMIDNTTMSLPVAYGWFEVMNDMIKVTAGRIDDGVWNSPSPEDRNYSNGVGFRVEVKPIEGLNVGWMIGEDNRTPDTLASFPSGAGKFTRPADLFGTSGFGAKYANDTFAVAAGLQLYREGTGRSKAGWGFGGRDDPYFFADSIGDGTVATGKVGTETYLGVEVKPVQGLTVQAGAIMGNLDVVKDYGYIWMNEYLAYDLGSITPRLTLHQKIDMSDTKLFKNPETGDMEATPAYMEFVPGVDFTIADNLSAYFEAPIKIWDKVFELGVKPGATYKFGPGLEIGAYYNLILSTNSYDVDSGRGNKLSDQTAIRNVVQFNLTWTF